MFYKIQVSKGTGLSRQHLPTSLIASFFCLSIAGHAVGEPLSFQSALTEMVNNNVDVRVQRTKLSASDSQWMAARGAFTPSLSLQAQQQNSNGNALPSALGSSYSTAKTYSANATWNLFRSGTDIASLRAAALNQSAHALTLEDLYLQAEDKSARALLELVAKSQMVDAYRHSEESARHFLEIAQARFAKSLLSREETDKIAVDASNAEARRSDAEMQFNEAKASVEALLGHSGVVVDWPWIKVFTATTINRWLNSKATSEAIQSRPDIRAARTTLETEEYRRRSLFRSMLPTIDLTYSVGETHLPNQTISAWSSLATLTIPLWNGFKDYSAYRVQVENQSASEFRLRQLEKDAKSGIESAQANYRLSLQQYQLRSRNLTVSKRILDQDVARFKIGRADANELNLDLTRVTEAEILAIQGAQHAHLSYMQLLHAFGALILERPE